MSGIRGLDLWDSWQFSVDAFCFLYQDAVASLSALKALP